MAYERETGLSSYRGVRSFILLLSIGDMIMVSIGIPFELLDSRFPLIIGQFELLCKLMSYMEVSATASGGFLMGFIALDRYFKVHKPLSRYGKDRSRTTRAYILGAFVAACVSMSPYTRWCTARRMWTPPSWGWSGQTVLLRTI
jgi:hypothetical protein